MDAVVVVLSMLVGAWACSPIGYRDVHMDEMATMAPIIAYGRVVHRYTDPSFTSSYTAELDVKCTYKGGPIPARINISLAGFVPGMCGEKNFTVGLEYVAFLRQDGAEFRQIYDGTKEASAAMDELITFCDLHLDYPSNATNQTTCPTKQFDASGCHRYVPPPPPMPALPLGSHHEIEGSGEDMALSLTGLTSRMTSPDTETRSSTGTSTDGATDEIVVGIVTMEPTKATKAAEIGSQNDGTIVSFSTVYVFMATLCLLLN